MSRNANPAEGALQDQTLRRSGVRDLSGDNQAGQSSAYPRVRTDILEPSVAGRTQVVNDVELHLGVPPERIDRMNEQRIWGFAGPSNMGGPNPRRAGEYMRVGHVPMAHVTTPAPQPHPGFGTADGLQIDAFRIGDPL